MKKERKKSFPSEVIAAHRSFSCLHAPFILLRCDKRTSGISFTITGRWDCKPHVSCFKSWVSIIFILRPFYPSSLWASPLKGEKKGS